MNQTQGYEQNNGVHRAAYFRARARGALKGKWGIAIGMMLLATLLAGFSVTLLSIDLNIDSDDVFEMVQKKEYSTLLYQLIGKDKLPDTFLQFFAAFFRVSLLVPLAYGIFTLAYQFFVGAPIALGYRKFNLNLLDGKETHAENLFDYFNICYWKSILLRVVYNLIMFVCSVLPIVIVSVVAGAVSYNSLLAIIRNGAASATSGYLLIVFSALLVGAVSFACGIFSIILSYRLQFVFIVLAEYPQMGIGEALRVADNMMKGNKWRLFCLDISFIGWYILGGLSFGIGLLWIIPYHQMARTAFYDEIAHRSASKDVEFPSLDPDDYDPNAAF